MFKKLNLYNVYVLVFLILALWSTFAFFTMSSLITSQEKYGALINKSGKQRMLSQKTSLYTHYVLENRKDINDLQSLIEEMKSDHQFIVSNLSSKYISKYYLDQNGLNGQVEHYFNLLDYFVAEQTKKSAMDVATYSEALLINLNHAVTLFESEHNQRVKELENRELFIYIGTLLTLILEALFIVFPIINRYKRSMKSLEEEVKSRTKDFRILAKIFENSNEGMIVTDSSENILNVNDAFTSITGYTKDEVLGRTPRILHSGVQSKNFYEEMWQSILHEGVWQGEIINHDKFGKKIYVHLTILKIDDDDKVYFVSIFADISERISTSKELQFMATHDHLTGLFNRISVIDHIDHAIKLVHRNHKYLAVIFVDLDNFKVINDSLGHNAGDQLLLGVSGRLNKLLRSSDIFGRIGGDEFIILIENIMHQGEELGIIEKIIKQFSYPFMIDSKEIYITASVGVTLYPEENSVEHTAENLIRKADLAMYKAKDLGKNQFFYYNTELEQTLQSRLMVNNQLKNAIINEELDLYFQPQLNLKKGIVNRAEALLRWNQNDSVISPLKFISIAEDSKLIEEIDLWVVTKTISYIEHLIENGHSDFLISLNMSGRTFTNKYMMSTILSTLKESGVASYIEIEITEGVLIENIIYASEIINKMKTLGISISLDDFGTGYSSFSYLSQLPIDTIKIDRSFISQLHKRRQEILVDAIISFSNKLGILVVAEGVEKQDQIAWLKEKNCDYLQGFIFSNPLTFSEFEKFFYAHEQSI